VKIVNLMAAFALCISPSAFCMEGTVVAKLYSDQCKEINRNNDEKVYNFLQKACATNRELAQQDIESKLKYFEEKLIKRKDYLLLADKKKFAIDDDTWQRCIEYAQQMDTFKKTTKPVIFDSIVHDNTLPPLFIELLKKEMVLNGLNPSMFNIEKKGNCFFSSRGYGVAFHKLKDVLHMEIKFPGFVKISESILLKISNSYRLTESLCALIVSTIIVKKTHPLIFLNLGQAAKKCSNTNPDTIRPDMSLFALQNQRTAALLKKWYKKCFVSHGSVISQQEFSRNINYYKELCKINRLHKISTWLKEYKAITQ